MNKKINFFIFDITQGNGTERAVANLSNNFANNNYSVSIYSILSQSGSNTLFDLKSDIKIHHLGYRLKSNIILNIFTYFKIFLLFIKLFSSKKSEYFIGTVHALNFILIGMSKFVCSSNKFIACEHISYKAISSYSIFFRKLVYKYLDAIVVLTNGDKNHYGDLKPKVSVISNELSFYPNQLNTNKQKTILAVGRLEFQKGYLHMLEAVKPVFKLHQDWKLKIFGNGSQKETINNKILDNNLQNFIEILEPIKNIEDEYKNASIYLMTSEFEGLPMVLIEAKASGLPIVSWDCPYGPREVIEENDGFLTPFKNTNEITNALLQLIDNETLREEFSKNAKINSLKFSSEIVLKKWQELFNNLETK
jgi:glycosyltransferase involved in cell wall biosynthesis